MEPHPKPPARVWESHLYYKDQYKQTRLVTIQPSSLLDKTKFQYFRDQITSCLLTTNSAATAMVKPITARISPPMATGMRISLVTELAVSCKVESKIGGIKRAP